MDLSEEVRGVLTTMKGLNRGHGDTNSSKIGFPQDVHSSSLGDLIDVNKISFSDDETWLYESPTKNSSVKNLKEWLYQDSLVLKDLDFRSNHLTLIREMTNLDTRRSIDSRTFTRPKKRLNRPSIEMYNEGYFKMDKSYSDSNRYTDEAESDASTTKLNDNPSLRQFKSLSEMEIPETDQAPLNFDFSQPTTSSIFDKMVAAAPDADSFQNMSPPSLVNSMCSSTFTNLMESSMIRNDPALIEIRDSDYSEDMLQDCEPPLMKSFTDSCSSLNSDTPEGFLKRTADTTFNKIYRKNVSIERENILNQTFSSDHTFTLDCTYQKESTSDVSTADVCSVDETISRAPKSQNQTKRTDSNVTITNSSPIFNGTYRKNMNTKLNDTFQKSPQYRSNDHLNRTITISDNVDSNRLNSSKRHSYVDNRACDLNQTITLKRNSVGYSAGSTDSLDYMSSLSNSSRGSNKMLNMAEVDAIVLQQEQSLQQVASTPNPSSKIISKLWENNYISPIPTLDRGDHMTDSEGSSNEDYLTVGSSNSSMRTPYGSETQVSKSNKSREHVSPRNDITKTHPKSLNAIPTKGISYKKLDNNFGGSYSNLKTVGTNLKGSYTNLIPAGANIKGSYTNLSTVNHLKGSYTNLKTMSSHLKGSYTQLKPVLTHLPSTNTNAKVFNSATITKQRANPPLTKAAMNAVKIAEVAPTLRDTASRDRAKSAAAISIKPPGKMSGLPRPTSSIPRPMGSRIPGPRTIRPPNPRLLSRPSSKVSMDCDF